MDQREVARLLAGASSDAFEVRHDVLAPGDCRPHDDAAWRDAVVLVEHGHLELECVRGRRHAFPQGSVLWLAGLQVRRLHNRRREPVVLVVVSRRRTPHPTGGSSTMDDELTYYATQSPFTDPGAQTAWLDGLPRDVASLRRIANGVVFHYRAHGDVTDHGFDRSRLAEIDLRYADRMFDRLRELQDGQLGEERGPTQQLLGCCRDSAVLFLSLARHVGIPARARVGFATYFVPGWYLDHVIAEVWDEAEQRWRLVEPDIGEGHVDATDGQVVDVLDVPRDRFVVGARAWRAARSGELDADRFVVAPEIPVPFLRGFTYLAHNLVFDLAALNRHELLLWDRWGMLHDETEPDPARSARLDALAAALEDPTVTLGEIQRLFEPDDVRVPEVVVTESPPVPTKTQLRTD
jgi:hypothetical protein